MKARMTADQLRGVTTLSGDVAIRAGAGSGKTTVLAHRFAHALAEGAGPGGTVDPARILTITFTNKAAGEIAERVRHVTRERSLRTVQSIDDAWISTIHSFCGRLLRRHFLESGVEPEFATVDEMTSLWLKIEAFERAGDTLYGEDAEVAALVDAFPVAELQQRVLACHDSARSLGLDPKHAVVPMELAELVQLRRGVIEAVFDLAEILQGCKQTDSLMEKAERLAEWTAQLLACTIGDAESCDALLGLHDEYDVKRLPGEAKEANESLKLTQQKLVAALLAFRHRPYVLAFERLLREYAVQYRQLKGERGLLDFDDLQETAVGLLEARPEIAQRYRRQFEHVMVDEFQDTNELQVRVLAPLLEKNLCVVGDERQSIYGFRYADVEIFGRVLEAADDVIELRANFRSHPAVLRFVNATFVQPHLFGESFMQLEPGKEEGWKLPLGDGDSRVECALVGVDESGLPAGRECEAEWIAKRIAALVRGGVAGADVAVLLRSAANAGLYANALHKEGIPVVVAAGADLFDAPEVDEVMALLRVVAVPGDDRALLKTLSGRMVSLTDDALLKVGTVSCGGSLWEGLTRLASADVDPCVTESDKVAIRHAHETIQRLGGILGSVRLSEFVREACEAFDYDVTLHAVGQDGIRAWGNVLKLMRYADGFERAESNDPVEFVEYLKRRGEADSDKSAPLQVGEDAVRIMTIHSAKGLEFPVVFVADLAARQVHDVSSALVNVGEHQGQPVAKVGLRLPKEAFGGAATPLYLQLEQERRERETQEEKRCLYVACTRAQELLVMSGCCKLDKPAEEGGGLIDWIREAIGDACEGDIELDGGLVRVERMEARPKEEERQRAEHPNMSDWPLAVPSPQKIGKRAQESSPPSVSYSALHLHQRCSLAFHAVYVLGLGRLVTPGDASSTDFGSAVHAVLQHAVKSGLDDGRVQAVARRFNLEASQAERVKQLATAFLASDLAARASTGDRVATEVPFAVSVGESVLRGSMDLVSWQGGQTMVVDYKTGRMPGEGNESREEGYRLQAECYALAMLESGADDVEVVFAFVEHDRVARSFHFDRSDAAAVHSRIRSAIEAVANGEPRALDEFDAEVCSDCPARATLCRVSVPDNRWR